MRLIDADELRKNVLKWMPSDPCGKEEKEFPFETDICVSMIMEIDETPTIVSEQNWILCSERMPEEREWIGTKRFGTTISDEVYVTFETPDGQRFADHISFQNGKLSRSDEHRMKVVYKGAKPVAWMPFPEPYQGRGEEHETD